MSIQKVNKEIVRVKNVEVDQYICDMCSAVSTLEEINEFNYQDNSYPENWASLYGPDNRFDLCHGCFINISDYIQKRK